MSNTNAVTTTTTPTQGQVQPIPQERKPPVGIGKNGLILTTMDDLFRFATAVSRSGFAPKGIESPEAIFVAVQMGMELGLTPMASLQNIAVINGRPSIYGDAALAVVRASGLLEEYQEEEIGERGKDTWGCRITGKRQGMKAPPEPTDFTVMDARTAQLWGKPGPWTQYPKRMLKFRARGFWLRDNFGDVLKGLRTTEEVQDDQEVYDGPPAANFSATDTRVLSERTRTTSLPDESGQIAKQEKPEAKAKKPGRPKKEPEPEEPPPVTPPAEEEPQQGLDLPPSEPEPEVPVEEVKLDPVYGQLQAKLKEAGFDFQTLVGWATYSGNYPNADSYSTLAEVPLPVVTRWLKAWTGLKIGLQAYKGSGA